MSQSWLLRLHSLHHHQARDLLFTERISHIFRNPNYMFNPKKFAPRDLTSPRNLQSERG